MWNDRKVSSVNFIALQGGQTLYIFPIWTNLHEILYWITGSHEKVTWWYDARSFRYCNCIRLRCWSNVFGVVETILQLFFLSIQLVRLQVFLPAHVPILLFAFQQFWLFHDRFRFVKTILISVVCSPLPFFDCVLRTAADVRTWTRHYRLLISLRLKDTVINI